jgi:hypothetical protein
MSKKTHLLPMNENMVPPSVEIMDLDHALDMVSSAVMHLENITKGQCTCTAINFVRGCACDN